MFIDPNDVWRSAIDPRGYDAEVPSPFASILHKDLIVSMADVRSFERGRAYFEQGRVRALTKKRSGIEGIVEGESPYRVRVWSKNDTLAYSCTCPQGEEGHFCKHCVALSLGWLSKRDDLPNRVPTSPTMKSPVPPQINEEMMRGLAAWAAKAPRDVLAALVFDLAVRNEEVRSVVLAKMASRS